MKAPRSTSQTLTKLHEATMTPAGTRPNPLLADPVKTYETTPEIDDHDLNVSVVIGLGFDFLLGSAVKTIADANKLKGASRRERIELAMRYLSQARVQTAVTAAVMLLVLPAWPIVILRTMGVV